MKKLETPLEYEVTCRKLAELQQLRDESRERPCENQHVKNLTLRSLSRFIKQLQEEKIWYECHTGLRNASAATVAPTTDTRETSTPCTN
jgi:hypothetical protein